MMHYWLGFATGAVGMLVLLLVLARRWKKDMHEVDALENDEVLVTKEIVIMSRFMLRQLLECPTEVEGMLRVADFKIAIGEEVVRMRGRKIELGETDEDETRDD